MEEGHISHLKKKGRGQAMVEFTLALPILLFVLFGIIEFARMVFAWMAVQNAARFGIRYAVTGEFNELYCIEAGNLLGAGHVNADIDGGDPQDCLIPDTYIALDKNDKERDLIDLARLFSIQDAAIGGGTGLWLRPNVSGNYEQYLGLHNELFIGLPGVTGFYHITICSHRNGTIRWCVMSHPRNLRILNARVSGWVSGRFFRRRLSA
ncbi:MAG: pilus assembly protein, partial [Anaerolineales bacterium]|nr:pilus assembly protein [Anaerolineales bacterium]